MVKIICNISTSSVFFFHQTYSAHLHTQNIGETIQAAQGLGTRYILTQYTPVPLTLRCSRIAALISPHFEFYYLEMSHSQIDYTKVRPPCHVKMQRRAKLVYTYHYIYAMLAMLHSSIMKRQSDWLSHGFKITTKYKYFVHMQIIGIYVGYLQNMCNCRSQ